MSIRKVVFVSVCVLITGLTAVSCKEEDPATPGIKPFEEFEENLSAYNFFQGDLKDLVPAEGVMPYDITTELFSDHTVKDRFLVLPEGKTVGYRSSGILDFPPGTIIIKTFSSILPSGQLKRIETRLLVLDPDTNEWLVMVYLWNDAQTDATKHIIGKTIPITVKDEVGTLISTNYRVPNTNDCKTCHANFSVVTPIGPKARNLNFTPSFLGGNQLEHWATNGLLTDLPASGVPVLPVWDDEANFTLNERARAYLEMNCAHCHSSTGMAYYTGFWLSYDVTDSSTLGIRKSPVAAGPGSGDLLFDIVPGNADSSIIIYRMNSTVAGIAMPEIAKSVVHVKGVDLSGVDQ